jgi:peptidyl-prolyl cis-trans isomerase B (cyclophilin B)
MKHLFFICLLAIGLTSCGDKTSMVEITTDYGTMKVELYDSTPQHRDNFIKLVKEGFYNDLLFHRVINGFMAQGGDPDSRGAAPDRRLGTGGPGYTVPAEIGAFHFKGALAAARLGGPSNPEKESSGSQFYIVQGRPVNLQTMDVLSKQKGFTYSQEDKDRYTEFGGTPMLDGDYTVFGMVVEGLDVIDKIASVQTAPGDRPVQDIKMQIKVIQ